MFLLFCSSTLEENEFQAVLRVRDSLQLIENALLEKEQVTFFKLNLSI